MNLRRDLELWTFNIVETAIYYEDFESWTKCILHYAMFKYGPHRLVFLNKSMGTRERNVMVCIFLDQGVAPSGGVGRPYWNRCDLVGMGVSLLVWA